MKVSTVIFLFLTVAIFLVIVIPFSFVYVGQKVDDGMFGKYEYVVRQDMTYWYTNSFEEKDGCITFTSNYETDVKWCEKYQVEKNYWKYGNPNLKTVLYGYN